jgi:type IV pilus assembly protein PilM
MARLNIPVSGFKVPIGVSSGGRPAAACELSTEGVLGAATPAAGQPAVYAFEPLPAGALVPTLSETNLPNPAIVSAAIRSVMAQVNPRVRSITLVVPDSAVRVFVLDFDTLPTRPEEALSVLRFRLRKSVPFDVEHAGVSYQVLSEGSARLETQWRVLAAILPGSVLAEYEAAVRAAGFEPGAVLPSSLAALCGLESQEAVLAVNLSSRALTTSIVSGNDVLLYRTIELPQATGFEATLPIELQQAILQQPEIQRSIAVAAAYYEDKLQVRPYRVLYSGILPARQFAELVDDPALSVNEISQHPPTGAATALGSVSVAAVTGVLAGTN